MQHPHYDLAIIGAGPAGSSAAIFAAKKGLKVALIDRAVFPRDKICGDQIILNILDLISAQGIDLKPLLEKAILPDCFEYITDTKSLLFDLRILPVKSISCRREIFDNFLFEEATKKTHFIAQGISNLEIQEIDTNYLISFIHNGSKISVTSKYIIGADGATSHVKRLFFKDLKFEKAIATRSYVKYKDNKQNIRFFYDKKIECGGYFWIFPLNKLEANCGIILFTDHWKQHFKTLKNAHDYFAKKHNNLISEPSEMSTWQTPFLLSDQSLIKETIILIGDAAGLVNPMFGHGIDAAILSAYIAINHIDKHIKLNNYNLDLYSKDIFELLISKYINHKQFRDTEMYINSDFDNRLNIYLSNKDNITVY